MPTLRVFRPFRHALLLSGALGALALGGCREEQIAAALANLPATNAAQGYDSFSGLYTGIGPAPIGYPVSRDDAWAWGERSYALDRVFYDTPPDYGFNYAGVQPFVWQTQDDWSMYADPSGEDHRYYYYEPGQTNPYFIRDDQHGYGFDDMGRLVAMYDLLGRLLPNSALGDQRGLAGDYYRRAYDMRRYASNARPMAIDEQLWRAREPYIVQDHNSWFRAAQHEPWAQYRQRTDGVIVRSFDKEHKRRKAHPGFPAHAKGWGPPFLREAERQVAFVDRNDNWRTGDDRRDNRARRDETERRQDLRREQERAFNEAQRGQERRLEDQRRGGEQARVNAERRSERVRNESRQRDAQRLEPARRSDDRGREVREQRQAEARGDRDQRQADAARGAERERRGPPERAGREDRPQQHARSERGEDRGGGGDNNRPDKSQRRSDDGGGGRGHDKDGEGKGNGSGNGKKN